MAVAEKRLEADDIDAFLELVNGPPTRIGHPFHGVLTHDGGTPGTWSIVTDHGAGTVPVPANLDAAGDIPLQGAIKLYTHDGTSRTVRKIKAPTPPADDRTAQQISEDAAVNRDWIRDYGLQDNKTIQGLCQLDPGNFTFKWIAFDDANVPWLLQLSFFDLISQNKFEVEVEGLFGRISNNRVFRNRSGPVPPNLPKKLLASKTMNPAVVSSDINGLPLGLPPQLLFLPSMVTYSHSGRRLLLNIYTSWAGSSSGACVDSVFSSDLDQLESSWLARNECLSPSSGGFPFTYKLFETYEILISGTGTIADDNTLSDGLNAVINTHTPYAFNQLDETLTEVGTDFVMPSDDFFPPITEGDVDDSDCIFNSGCCEGTIHTWVEGSAAVNQSYVGTLERLKDYELGTVLDPDGVTEHVIHLEEEYFARTEKVLTWNGSHRHDEGEYTQTYNPVSEECEISNVNTPAPTGSYSGTRKFASKQWREYRLHIGLSVYTWRTNIEDFSIDATRTANIGSTTTLPPPVPRVQIASWNDTGYVDVTTDLNVPDKASSYGFRIIDPWNFSFQSSYTGGGPNFLVEDLAYVSLFGTMEFNNILLNDFPTLAWFAQNPESGTIWWGEDHVGEYWI